MKQIFILNGVATSGKNTFVDFCKCFADVHHYSYVDFARNKIAPLCGYKGEKSDKERDFLSNLNDILEKYYDLPFKDITEQVESFLQLDDESKLHILFIDIRAPHVIRRACQAFDAKSVFVDNNRARLITSNHTDANVKKYKYDIVIDNNGTLADLKTKAEYFCKQLENNQ